MIFCGLWLPATVFFLKEIRQNADENARLRSVPEPLLQSVASRDGLPAPCDGKATGVRPAWAAIFEVRIFSIGLAIEKMLPEKVFPARIGLLHCRPELVHTMVSIIIGNRTKPANTIFSLSSRVKTRRNRFILRKDRSTSFRRRQIFRSHFHGSFRFFFGGTTGIYPGAIVKARISSPS